MRACFVQFLECLADGYSGKKCQLLGFATQETSSFANDTMPDEMIPDESNFAWLLKQYPRGYGLDCDEPQGLPWTDDGALPRPHAHYHEGTYEWLRLHHRSHF